MRSLVFFGEGHPLQEYFLILSGISPTQAPWRALLIPIGRFPGREFEQLAECVDLQGYLTGEDMASQEKPGLWVDGINSPPELLELALVKPRL